MSTGRRIIVWPFGQIDIRIHGKELIKAARVVPIQIYCQLGETFIQPELLITIVIFMDQMLKFVCHDIHDIGISQILIFSIQVEHFVLIRVLLNLLGIRVAERSVAGHVIPNSRGKQNIYMWIIINPGVAFGAKELTVSFIDLIRKSLDSLFQS